MRFINNMETNKNRRKNEYIKYSKVELESYVGNTESCVKKIKSEIHLGLAPWMLKDLQSSILKVLSVRIGKYDAKLNGIVLDFRNTRILSNESIVRHDSPVIHINVETNFYVFIPEKDAELAAMIKHITITKIESNILAVVYRVFNVKIILKNNLPQNLLVNKEIKIRIVDFHFFDEIPYILAELVGNEIDSGFSGAEESVSSKSYQKHKKVYYSEGLHYK